jgi:sugar lactone lactonase YvrE
MMSSPIPAAPILPFERGSVFVDGTLGAVRLKHPEGIAVADDGAIWCGGDGGEIYRVPPDGSSFEQVASTGGFTLGIAFDGAGGLFTCDLGHRAVFRLDLATRELTTFAARATPPRSGSRTSRWSTRPAAASTSPTATARTSRAPGVWRFDLTSGRASSGTPGR